MPQPQKWSRRQFMDLSLGAAVGAMLTGCAGAPEVEKPIESVDVAIIGGGLSGMAAARELMLQGIENFVVLEARDRVGGRTLNHDLGGGYIAEGGGQWVGPTQTAVLELARDLGVGTFPTHLEGNAVVLLNGKRMVLPKGLVLTPPSGILIRLDEMARTVSLQAPWNTREAGEWDRTTVAQWAKANGATSSDWDRLRQMIALDLASTPEEVSLLYFLYYIQSAGGIEMLESFEGGAQTSRIIGGSQVLSLKIADTLGDRLRLSSPVSRINQDATGVNVKTLNGSFRARRVIMAMMPSLCAQIGFDPPLPANRRALQAHWKARSTAVKINVVYEKPFWRGAGLSGLSFSGQGPTPFTTDNSPPDGSIGVLLILVDRSALSDDPESRRLIVIESLADLFGAPARRNTGYHEMDWSSETYTGGCVSPLGPGVLTQYGNAMRGSFGRVTWAGTEASEIWTGYMDGAVRAGQSAARDVAKAMAV